MDQDKEVVSVPISLPVRVTAEQVRRASTGEVVEILPSLGESAAYVLVGEKGVRLLFVAEPLA